MLSSIALSMAFGAGLIAALPCHTTPSETSSAVPVATPTQIPQDEHATPSGTSSSSLWQPTAGTTWQIILSELPSVDDLIASADVEVYDLDMNALDSSYVKELQARGKKAICYISAGTFEDWRNDADQFTNNDLGNDLEDWAGEKWLDVRSANVLRIMQGRIDETAEKGCDGIDPDNMDGYENNSGLDFTIDDSANYLRSLASYAAQKGISIGLKNAADLVDKILDVTQFTVNEQCLQYGECSQWKSYVDSNKAVFHIEYPAETDSRITSTSEICAQDGATRGFSSLIKNMNLDTFIQQC